MTGRDNAALGAPSQAGVGLDDHDQPVRAAVDIKDMQAFQAQEQIGAPATGHTVTSSRSSVLQVAWSLLILKTSTYFTALCHADDRPLTHT